VTPAEALLAGYARAYTARTDVAAGAVARAWWTFGNVDDAAAARFAELATRLAAAYRSQGAQLTSAYLARQVALITGTDPTAPVLVPVEELTGLALRGVEDAELWQRPVLRARRMLGAGDWWATAMGHGERAARELAVTDLALVQRHTTRAALAGDGRVSGYRRALTGRGCSLCAAAAPRVYRTDRLMPIHSHCRCVVTPVTTRVDPAAAHNETLIDLTGVTPAGRVAVDLTTEIAPSLQEVS
jgi:hypothetical protein